MMKETVKLTCNLETSFSEIKSRTINMNSAWIKIKYKVLKSPSAVIINRVYITSQVYVILMKTWRLVRIKIRIIK